MTDFCSPGSVTFSAPDLPLIRKCGFTAIDMHVHTSHSDSPVRVRDALRFARAKKTGLAITDHNAIGGVAEAMREKPRVLIVPGMEISALDGPHILVYFYSTSEMQEYYEKYIAKNKQKSPYLAIKLTTKEILDSLTEVACITSAAHPYGYFLFNKGLQKCIDAGYLNSDLLGRLEAVEVICGSMGRALNTKARALARDRNLGMTGGSDGHALSDLGTVVTCAAAETADDLLDAISGRQTAVMGLEKTLVRKCLTAPVMAAEYIPYLAPSLRIHYEQNAPRVRRYLKKRRKGNG